MPKIISPSLFASHLPQSNSIAGAPTTIAAFLGCFKKGPMNRAVQIHSQQDFINVFGGLDNHSEASFAIQQYFLNGGKTAWVVRVLDAADSPLDAGKVIGDPARKTGIFALEDVDLINLLCIPGSVRIGGATGAAWQSTKELFEAAGEYCEQRRAFFIMDGPEGLNDPSDVERWLGNFPSVRHRNAALYYPRLLLPDPENNQQLRSVGASGTVAGLFVRTDEARGVWKAPAGTEASLSAVSGLAPPLSEQESAHLNSIGVNCIRDLPNLGLLNWGARTLVGLDQAATEWKYISPRRLALFIEESIVRGTRWTVFEPNAEPLWARLRTDIDVFLQSLWRAGAFPRSTPKAGYFVKCDSETTTPLDIRQGVLNMLVGFAPLKPAEFIVLKIQQRAKKTAP